MSYKHGIYAKRIAGDSVTPEVSGTLPVYFGVAPVHQLESYEGKTNVPILLDGASEAVSKIGYSLLWDDYSLSEAVFAHFMRVDAVGPIVVINVLDPAKHRASSDTTATLTFANGKAEIADSKAILSTITLTGKTKGTDYTVEVNDDGTAVIVRDLTGTMTTAAVAYRKIDLTAVSVDVVTASISTVLPNVYEVTGMIPSLLLAPGWSQDKAVADALVKAADKINGHWDAYALVDIAPTAATVTAAKAKKNAEGRSTAKETPCWPMVTDGIRNYHLSCLCAVMHQMVDTENEDIPYESCSNKILAGITGLVVANSSGDAEAIKMTIENANELNAVGIRTALFWGGSYRIWGPHTGAYSSEGDNAADEIFDCSVRMVRWLGNTFQALYGDVIDRPMHRALVDSILNEEQMRLDNLVSRGALLGGKIRFDAAATPTNDIVSGDFALDVDYTTTPAARAIVCRYRYSSSGLSKLTGGEE